jgi:hypothetical protein
VFGIPEGNTVRVGHAAETVLVGARVDACQDPDHAAPWEYRLYAGPAAYMGHTVERPMHLEADHELPADVFAAARVAAG